MRMMIEFNRDDIQKRLPYMLLWETRSSSRWQTGRRKRLYQEQFTEQERHAASRIFSQARQWAAITGAPDNVTMSIRTAELWEKLGRFCAEL